MDLFFVGNFEEFMDSCPGIWALCVDLSFILMVFFMKIQDFYNKSAFVRSAYEQKYFLDKHSQTSP